MFQFLKDKIDKIHYPFHVLTGDQIMQGDNSIYTFSNDKTFVDKEELVNFLKEENSSKS